MRITLLKYSAEAFIVDAQDWLFTQAGQDAQLWKTKKATYISRGYNVSTEIAVPIVSDSLVWAQRELLGKA